MMPRGSAYVSPFGGVIVSTFNAKEDQSVLLTTRNMQVQAEELLEALRDEEVELALRHSDGVSPLRMSQLLTEAPKDTVRPFVLGLDLETQAEVLAHFPEEMSLALLVEMPSDQVAQVLNLLPPAYLTELLAVSPESRRGEWREALQPALRDRVEQIARFPEDSAGAAMTVEFLAVEAGSRVADVRDAVRSAGGGASTTAYVYVVSDKGRLRGAVSIRELMLARRQMLVDEIMTQDLFAVHSGDPASEAARRIRSRHLKMIPVVDNDDVLLGVITIDAAIDILAEDMADDFVAINAASPDESFYTPPREAVKKRLPWMAANVFLNLGAVWVISSFEATLVQVAILAAFLPMITDMGGNVGIQALSVSIRSMALGEARLGDVWKAVHKEATIGLFNGLALGVLFSVIAFAMQGNAVLGIVAGVALAVNVLVAGLVGGTIPFLIKRLGKDPAMMTGPILTTITDITGVSIYLGLSTVFLASLIATGTV